MKKLTFIIVFVFCSTISFCQTKPKSITEAVNQFIIQLSEKEKSEFVLDSENIAVSKFHMTIGMGIRNGWIRHGDKRLAKAFNKLGIYHPDDMSSIIIKSAHRKLNNKPIELKKQVQNYKDYWKPIIEQNQKSQTIAVKNYNRFKVGDEITILYPVDISDNYKNAVIYEYDQNWIFDPKKDLKLTGIVTKKFYLNSKSNVFFELKIIKINFPEILVLMQKMEIGETYDFNLDKLRIQ